MANEKGQPTFFMIAGPNGAGKSTLYEMRIKPKVAAPFINADIIQRDELKNPSMDASYEAARIAESRRQAFLKEGKSFVSESTFSHPSKLLLIDEAKAAGFRVVVYHVNLRSPDLSVSRVSARVKEGGHNVPEDKIRERYERNKSLIREAVLKSDYAFVYDNSGLNRPIKHVITFESGQVRQLAENVPEWVRDLYAHELRHFSQARQNPLAASFQEAREIAKTLKGGEQGVFIPDVKNQKVFRGPIVGETSHHVLQRIQNDRLVAHIKAGMNKSPAVGKSVKIEYSTKYKSTVQDIKASKGKKNVKSKSPQLF